MEISGKIIAIPPQQSGVGKNGPWRSQDYVLETEGQYPKKVCFNLFNDRIDKFPIDMGEQVTVSFDIESREYNGRWYTTIRAWNVKKAMEQAQMPGDMPPPPGIEQQPQQQPEWRNTFDSMDNDDANTDLPF